MWNCNYTYILNYWIMQCFIIIIVWLGRYIKSIFYYENTKTFLRSRYINYFNSYKYNCWTIGSIMVQKILLKLYFIVLSKPIVLFIYWMLWVNFCILIYFIFYLIMMLYQKTVCIHQGCSKSAFQVDHRRQYNYLAIKPCTNF